MPRESHHLGRSVALLAGLAGSLQAQAPSGARWTAEVTAGPAFGGPTTAMKAKLLDEGWTERYCDFKLINCFNNPAVSRPSLQFSASIARRLSPKLEAKAIFSTGDLGLVNGMRNGYLITADWTMASVATAISVKPVPRFRIGGGPLLAVVTGQTVPNEPRSTVRPGMLFESSIRSSEQAAVFMEATASYVVIARRWEGPWPAQKGAWQGYQGPSRLHADYTHLTLALGLGWHL